MYSIPKLKDIPLTEYKENGAVKSDQQFQAFEEEFDDMRRAEIILPRHLRETSENAALLQALKLFQDSLNTVKVAYTTMTAEKRYAFISSRSEIIECVNGICQ